LRRTRVRNVNDLLESRYGMTPAEANAFCLRWDAMIHQLAVDAGWSLRQAYIFGNRLFTDLQRGDLWTLGRWFAEYTLYAAELQGGPSPE